MKNNKIMTRSHRIQGLGDLEFGDEFLHRTL